MATTEEKAFRDLQNDARLKKLQRNLKLTQIKNAQSSQLPTSPHMSISGISSIHGDSPMLDLSYCSSSVSSTRAGSVVITSSNNLKKKISHSPKTGPSTRSISSSAYDLTFDSKKKNEDRAMMPPPSVINRHNPPSLSDGSMQNGRAVNSTPKTSVSQSKDNQIHNNNPTRDASQTDYKVPGEIVTPENESRHDTSKQNGRGFKKWTVRLNNHGEIIVRGKLESGEQVRSKAVRKRLDANTVLSLHTHKYRLLGNIHDVREELPEYIRGKFFNGFPMDWENVREIWKGYVASGHSLRFRWPRPVADSDDDLRSDITDMTVACVNNTSSRTIPFLTSSYCPQTLQEVDKKNRKRAVSPEQQKVMEDSDVSILSTKQFNATTKSPATEAFKKSEDKTGPIIDNSLDNQNSSPKCENFIPRWKVDVIIDNLMNNKHCCKEYIEKIIMAIDCINELVVMSPTSVAKTTPDKDVSLHTNNSKGHKDTIIGNKISSITPKTITLENQNSSRLNKGQATVSPSNSYSLDNWSESEEESLSNRHTFVRKQTGVLRKNNTSHKSLDMQESRNSMATPKNFLNHPNAVNRSYDDSSPVKQESASHHTRRPMNNEHQVTCELPNGKNPEKTSQTGRHKKKTICNSTDSDCDDASVSNERKSNLANQTPSIGKNSQPVSNSKLEPVASRKHNNGPEKGISVTQYYSDVSIICTQTVPSIEPRTLCSEKIVDQQMPIHPSRMLRSHFNSMESENIDRTQAGSSVLGRNANLSNEKNVGVSSSSVLLPDQSTVQLNKVPIYDQNNGQSNRTPSKSQKAQTSHRTRKIVMGPQANQTPENNLENIGMRISSRGRRILPPLDYWNGERVTLKGQELIYSPSTSRASMSANSSSSKHVVLSPNDTAVAEQRSVLRNPDKSSAGLTPHTGSNSRIKSTNQYSRQTEGVLMEITCNNDRAIVTTSERRRTRNSKNEFPKIAKKNGKARQTHDSSDSSSDDGKIRMVRNRKRRKLN